MNELNTSAVIVAYMSAGTLLRAVRSARDSGITEIVVVNNVSPDDSAAIAAEAGATVITAARNDGFGAGCNLGMAHTSSAYILLLNPDASVASNTVPALERYLDEHPRAAIVASDLITPTGGTEVARRRFPSLVRTLLEPGLSARLDERYYARRQPNGGRVDWVTGAVVLARRCALEQVGGFDERYFLYFEDVDLAARLSRNGWESHWIPGYPATHVSGASTIPTLEGQGKAAWVDGFLRFTRSHSRRPTLLRAALALNLTARALVWSMLRRRTRRAKWWAAAKVALRG